MFTKFIAIFLFVLFVVLVFGLFIIALKRGSKAYEKEKMAMFEDVARSLGLRFEKNDLHGMVQKMSQLWLLGRHRTPIENIVTGKIGRDNAFICEHREKYSLHGKSIRKWTVCFLELDYSFSCRLLVFTKLNTIVEKIASSTIGLGLSPLQFSDVAVQHRLTAFADDPEAAKQLITREFETLFLQYAERASLPVMFQIYGNVMAVNTYETKAFDKSADIVEMAKFVTRLAPLIRRNAKQS